MSGWGPVARIGEITGCRRSHHRVSAGQRLRKVRSAYPTGTRFVLSRSAALAPGACYVWRVWPFRGDAYTDAPLAVSDFCVRSRPATTR